MPRARTCCFLVGVLLLGCGARSTLEDAAAAGAGGAGASTSHASSTATASSSSSSTGGGGTGGGGGQGGAPPVTFCPVLAPDPLRVTLATSGERFLRPTMIAVGNPGVVLVHNALLAPSQFASRTSITTFDPGEAWPSVPGSTTMGFRGIHAETRRDRPLALSRNESTPDGAFRIALESDLGTTEDRTYFGYEATSDGAVPGQTGGFDVDQVWQPLAIAEDAASGSAVTLTGVESTMPNGTQLSSLRALVTPAAQLKHELGGGCVAGPIAADVVGLEKGWFVAAALGQRFLWSAHGIIVGDGSSACGRMHDLEGPRWLYTGVLDGTARRLQGNQPAVTEGADITRVRLAPGGGAEAWMVWTVAAHEGAPVALRVARIGGVGAIVRGPFEPRGLDRVAPLSLGIAAFGEDLLVATAPDRSSGPGEIALEHLNATGSEAPVMPIPTGGPITGAISVVADAARGVVVLAWSEVPAGASEEVIQVVKLTCLTPDH